MKQNYQLLLDERLKEFQSEGRRPTLLLHACCAPCSSYVLEYLAKFFRITMFFYNPNISPRKEYDVRYEELCRLILEMGLDSEISVVDSEYEPERFFEIAKGLEELDEGGERCRRCYALRLEATAKAAAEGYDFFSTTLSISPHKNATWLNEIGKEMADK